MNKDRKFKLNIFDALALVLLIFTAVFGARMLFAGGKPEVQVQMDAMVVEFYVEESPDFAVNAIDVGMYARDPGREADFGKVTDIKIGDAKVFVETGDGEMVFAPKEGYSSVTITFDSLGFYGNNGVRFGSSLYYIGMWTTMDVGESRFWGRISAISKK